MGHFELCETSVNFVVKQALTTELHKGGAKGTKKASANFAKP